VNNKSNYIQSPTHELADVRKTSSLRRRANEEYRRKILREEMLREFGPVDRELVKKYLRADKG
jgi:hypothetical protein